MGAVEAGRRAGLEKGEEMEGELQDMPKGKTENGIPELRNAEIG